MQICCDEYVDTVKDTRTHGIIFVTPKKQCRLIKEKFATLHFVEKNTFVSILGS